MIGVLIESSCVIVILCFFRFVFRSIVRADSLYKLWLLPLIYLVPCLPWFLFHSYERRGFFISSVENVIDLLRGVFTNGAVEQISTTTPARTDLFCASPPLFVSLIWFSGTVLILLWTGHVNHKFRRELLEKRVRVPDDSLVYPVYEVEGLASPCVFKVQREKAVYIPTDVMIPESYKAITAHEVCHIRQHDLFWSRLRVLFLALYWVNPFAWLAVFLSKADCEMACDEKSLQSFGMDFRCKYGTILVDMVNTKRPCPRDDIFSTATTMISSKKGLRLRVRQIVSNPKSEIVATCITFLLGVGCIALCCGFDWEKKQLTPQETIQQYFYYLNHGYEAGERELWLGENPVWEDKLPFTTTRVETSKIVCTDVSGEKQYSKYKPVGESYSDVIMMKVAIGDGTRTELMCLVRTDAQTAWKIYW